jgi:hypothetical protein
VVVVQASVKCGSFELSSGSLSLGDVSR